MKVSRRHMLQYSSMFTVSTVLNPSQSFLSSLAQMAPATASTPPPTPSADLRKKSKQRILRHSGGWLARFENAIAAPTTDQVDFTKYWDFFSESPSTDPAVTIHCIHYSVPKDSGNTPRLSFTKDLRIVADTVDLQGTISAPGKTVSIIARSINFSGGKIDVSGLAGRDASSPAPSGTGSPYPVADSGQNGRKPADADGHAGGTVRLYAGEITGSGSCLANGGNGGKGQDGGNGAPGAAGPTAADKGQFCSSGQVGNRGGNGGAAGAGSDGGNGGNAGSIAVRTLNALPASVVLSSALGRGGSAGKSGKPGSGGPGSIGGHEWHEVDLPCPRGCDKVGCREGNQLPSGAAGSTGATAPAGHDGAPGAASVPDIASTSFAQLLQQWDLSQLAMLQHRIQLDYLSGDYESAAMRAFWVEQLTAGGAAEVQPIHAQAAVVVDRLRMGLDVYGMPRDYVSLLPKTAIDGLLRSQLDAASMVEKSFTGYFSAAQGDVAKVGNLQQAIDDAQHSIDDKKDSLNKLLKDRDLLLAQVQQMSLDLGALGNEIQKEHTAFVAAVEAHNGGCSFGDCLIGLGTVIAVAASGGSALTAIGAGIKVLPPGTHTAAPGRIEALKKISGGLVELQNQYGALKKLYNPQKFSDLDFTKLALEQKQYDDFLNQYRELPEANQLRSTIDRYFELNQDRNQRLLDYSASFATEDALRADMAALSDTVAGLQQKLSIDQMEAAQSSAAQTFMGGLYLSVRQDLCSSLWLKRKIVEYALLTDVDFSVNDMDVAALDAKSATLDQLFTQYQNEAKTRYITFPVPVKLLLLANVSDRDLLDSGYKTIPALELGSALKVFAAGKNGNLHFTLPSSCPAFTFGWSSIRLTGIDARLLGVSIPPGYGQPRISIDAIHQGLSLFITPMKELRSYSHPETVAQITYDIGAPDSDALKNNLVGEKDQYMGVSPFAHWTLRVNPHSDNAGTPALLPDLSKVIAIELTFYGQYQGFDPTATTDERSWRLTRGAIT